jgi:nucleoside-diphosphate-sugar epimerase
MDLDAYVSTNEGLTRNLLAAVGLPSVTRVVTVSSGAAVYPIDALAGTLEGNPYGYLKRRAEEGLASAAGDRGIAAVVARAWSVSGAFVQKPRSYAFSDMILQAVNGAIHVSAVTPVYRRYVSVEDLLAVALASASEPGFREVSSGGELLEMGQLASAVASVVNPRAKVTRADSSGGAPNLYYPDPASWDASCIAAQFSAAPLPLQIASTHAGLIANN